MIILVAVAVSAFVDNVPFLLTMIPVTESVANQIGASANIVTLGLLRKRGYPVGFGEFMKIGVPFTVAAVLAGALFVWVVWAP